jgi:hypothetical protein
LLAQLPLHPQMLDLSAQRGHQAPAPAPTHKPPTMAKSRSRLEPYCCGVHSETGGSVNAVAACAATAQPTRPYTPHADRSLQLTCESLGRRQSEDLHRSV